MKNIMNTIKTASIIFAFAFVFMASVNTANAECEYGPIQPGSSIWGCVGDNSTDEDEDEEDDETSDELNVSTLSASSIDTDSATLRGEITSLDTSNEYERYFEWGNDEDDLDHTLSVSGTTDNEGDFSRTLSGLSDDNEYFYRACAEEENGGDEDCGSIRSFTTDEEDNSNDDDDNDDDDNDDDDNNGSGGSVLTTEASAIGYSSAVLNGVVVNNSGSQTVWFEWGRTTSLGNRTSSRVVYNEQSMVSVDISGLSSGTNYFFRLVSGVGEIGDMKTFMTRSWTGTTTTTTPPTPPVTTISSDQYLNVDLISSAKDVKSGDVVMYQAVYENLTNKTLNNINVIVDFPEGINIKNTESGTIVGQRIEFNVPTLAPKTKQSFSIETVISSKSSDKFLVGIIEAIYDHPTQENTRIGVVDYAIIKVIRGGSNGNSDQSASALFAGTFFPHGIGGWLILAGAIILLIVLARKLYKQKEDEKKKEEEKTMKPGIKIAK